MATIYATMPETLTAISAECARSWKGAEGEKRAAAVQALLARVLPEYAGVLGLTEEAVLNAIEEKRDYSAVNYYQEANFPSLADVTLFDTLADFRATYPSGKYVCPACEEHSTDPYQCNSGAVRGKGKTSQVCNWKSWGFFRTMGKGLRVVVKDRFVESPGVHEIFMPLELAQQKGGA